MTYRVRNIVLAAVLVAIGVVLATSYLASRARSIESGQDLVEVLVATRDIPAGTPLAELQDGGFVEVRKVRSRDAVPGAMDDLRGEAGRATSTRIFSGDQIALAKLADESGLAPAARISGTERWVAFPIGDHQDVGGQLGAGDHVDIFATRIDRGEVQTVLVARDVEIVDVPSRKESSGTGVVSRTRRGQAYTFEVSDRIADRLVWAASWQNTDGLHLALRPAASAADGRVPAIRVRLDDGMGG